MTFECDTILIVTAHGIKVTREELAIVEKVTLEVDCCSAFLRRLPKRLSQHNFVGPTPSNETCFRVTSRLTVGLIKATATTPTLVIVLGYPSNKWTEDGQYYKSFVIKADEEDPTWDDNVYEDYKTSWDRRGTLHNPGNPFFTRYFQTQDNVLLEPLISNDGTDKMRNSKADHYCAELVSELSSCNGDEIKIRDAISLWGIGKCVIASRTVLNVLALDIGTPPYRDRFRDTVEKTASEPSGIRSRRDELARLKKQLTEYKKRLVSLHESFWQKNQDVKASQFQATTKRLLDNIEEMHSEIDDLLTTISRQLKDAFEDLQILLTQTQLKDSRISLHQNATMRRLTALAFIFIPLSAISSVFGMNVYEFTGEPGPP
ncbi:hypothetical protein OHC33_011266, partial [Knufia fluminis]